MCMTYLHFWRDGLVSETSFSATEQWRVAASGFCAVQKIGLIFLRIMLSKWERGLKNLHNFRVYCEGNEDRKKTRPFQGGLGYRCAGIFSVLLAACVHLDEWRGKKLLYTRVGIISWKLQRIGKLSLSLPCTKGSTGTILYNFQILSKRSSELRRDVLASATRSLFYKFWQLNDVRLRVLAVIMSKCLRLTDGKNFSVSCLGK